MSIINQNYKNYLKKAIKLKRKTKTKRLSNIKEKYINSIGGVMRYC
jgi:hypothetical protein